MIIEFCGIPGGKSTLAKAYAERYKDSAVLVTLDMYKRLPEIEYGILFACRHPLSFFWLCAFVLRYHMRGLFWYSLHLALRACAKYQKASLATSSRIILIDEGLIHALGVLSSYPLKKEEICKWMRRIVLPDAACIALSGDFHRFHNSHAALHPRVGKGDEELKSWEFAVKENTSKVNLCLVDNNVLVWHIPNRTSSSLEGNIDALHAYLATI